MNAILARTLMIAGATLFVIGALFYLGGRLNLPLGRLPGDIRIQSGNLTCFFPLASMILISILLSAGLTLLARLLNR